MMAEDLWTECSIFDFFSKIVLTWFGGKKCQNENETGTWKYNCSFWCMLMFANVLKLSN